MSVMALVDIFKSAYRPTIQSVPEGITGCVRCRDVSPWGFYSFECSHHRNKRASREWNEARAKRKEPS